MSESTGFADTLGVRARIESTTKANDWIGSLGRWMIFCAGLTVLVAVLLLPAHVDLRETRTERDRALYLEEAQHTRIERYRTFLADLEHPSESTIDLLAMSQLGMIPADREVIMIPGQPADPMLFEHLEPAIASFEPRIIPVSRLETLATGHRSRLWVALLGAVAVLYGLLPPAKSEINRHR